MSYTINNYRANGVVLNSGTQNPTTVTSSGSITNQFYAGDVLYGTTAAAWNITNYGVISTGTAASGNAVHLAAGGTLSNAAGTSLISGYANGVLIGGGAGTITNSGTITGTETTSDGVNLAAGGAVYNAAATALIAGNQFGVYIGGATGTVDNLGTISGSGLFGVELQAGGGVSNASTGVILGGDSGVVIYSTPGTVINDGTISGAGAYGNGVHLSSSGLVANQSTSALITGYRGVYVYGGNSTVTNAGTIDGAKIGVRLSAGTFSNSGTIIGVGKGVAFGSLDSVSLYVPSFSNTGTITATGTTGIGVDGYRYTGGGALTVTNYGTIAATASGGTGVALSAGGGVSNANGSALIAGDVSGVLINGTTGTVSNLGAIEGTGTSGVGVDLAVGGTVVDAGTIIGGNGTAIYLGGAGNNLLDLVPGYALTGNVVATGTANALELAVGGSGTITGLGLKFQNFTTVTVDAGANWVLAGNNAVGPGVTLTDFGTLTNAGSLTGAGSLVVDPASLVNSGYIGLTVTLSGGGYLDNTATGTIAAAGNAVYATGAPATVVNSGTIMAAGTPGSGVVLQAGGYVSNTSSTALISGYDGIVTGTAGTVSNFGTITGTGPSSDGILLDGGYVSNSAGGALIAGSAIGVQARGAATVSNSGTITGGGAFGDGVALDAGGTVTNFGTIDSTGGGSDGVNIQLGGYVANVGSNALISSYNGVVIAGIGTVSNSGTIAGSGLYSAGVVLADSGAVSNSGTIESSGVYSAGVLLFAGGSVSNAGSGAVISGDAYGISARGGGTVDNSGLIEGLGSAGVGVYLSSATLTNAGTISGAGGTAVYFGGSGNLLVVDPGAVFTGIVNGGIGGSTLELASAVSVGTLSGLGTSFVNFGAVTVDAGANWVLTGGNTVGAGVTLSDLGTLTDFGSLTNDGVIAGAGSLVVDPASLVNNGYIGLTVTLSGGGYLDNTTTGTIVATGTAVYGTLAAATIVNSGTISGSGTAGYGVKLTAGGVVTNAAGTALITGVVDGVAIDGSAGTVSNLGTISGTGPAGVGLNLLAGGYVSNGASVGASALIAGYDGVRLSGPAGTLVNFGTIDSTGAAFGAQALDFLSGGTVTNNGTIVGLNSDASGINAGFASDVIINGTGALIAGWLNGIDQFSGIGTIVNSGTVESTNGTGVYLQAGGRVDNTSAAAQIAGYVNGVYIGGGSGTISNLGAITGSGTGSVGVRLRAGGYVTNSSGGAIDGGANGIFVAGGAGTVVNSGVIAATDTTTGAGIALHLGGYVSNAASATISGHNNGVFVAGAAATVVNSGAIASTGTTSGVAVYLASGGTVTNVPGGVLSAYRTAVSLKNSAGTVINYASIASSGTYYSGIYLGAGGAVTNRAGGTIISGWLGVNAKNVAATVSNFGTIASTKTSLSPLGFHGAGVLLQQGGLVVNGAGTAANALITGYERGVYIGGGSGVPNPGTVGTIVNYGTIASTGTGTVARAAAQLTAGGTINNYGVIEGAGHNAINLGGTVAGTVDNFGLIENFAAHAAIYSSAGGIVTNAAGATIASTFTAISFNDTAGTTVSFGTIVNSGTITSTASGAQGAGVYFGQGGTLMNQAGGFIQAYRSGVSAKGSAAAVTNHGVIASTGNNYSGVYLGAGGTVINDGTIGASGGGGVGVRLGAGGSVANASGGLIEGVYDGVRVTGAADTVSNLGTIEGTGTFTDGVALFAGGSVVNGAAGAATALIEGNGRRGVFVYGGAGTVTNFATIQSLSASYVAVYLKAGGSVSNKLGGLILGAPGIAGIAIGRSGGTVGNYGSISGVFLGAGGSVTNRSGGVIGESGTAITVFANTGTIANYGTIASTGSGSDGVYLGAGGDVTNATGGLIEGVLFGIDINGTGSVANFATIAASGTGVHFAAAGSTLTNAGTISGGTAVSFTGGGNRLIVEPGAVISGAVNGGGGGGDVVELAPGSGSIGGLGTSITGFDQLVVDSAATWLLTGTNTVGSLVDSGILGIGSGAALAITNGASGAGSIDFAAPLGALAIDGTTMPALPIVGFAQGDSIDLPNVTSTAITYAGGVVALSNGTTQVAQLNVATPYASPSFAAMRDATGGTLITVSPPLPANYTFVTNFAKNNLIQTALIKEFPSGITTGNQGLAVPFDVTPDANGNNFDQITSTLTINVSIPSVTNIFTLLNAYRPPPGATGATIEFVGSLGADQIFNLVYGSDVRDFFQDGFANTINGTTTQNAFTVAGVQDGGGTGDVNTGVIGTYNIDEQDFALAPAFASQTLQQIVITNVAGGATPILLGLTALQTAPVAPTISGPSDTNIVQPAISGQGLAGDTVTLFINGTAASSGTVASGDTWSIQAPSPLADGVYNLTATQTDMFGNVSPVSAAAALRIDTTPPVTVPASLSVFAGSGAVPIGIAAPSDSDDAAAALTVTVTALPSDGTVTLADGTTPVTLGVLAGGVPALTGLDFIAGAGSSGSFRYTVTDPAGNATAGAATLTVTGGTVHQFDFIFTYSDGKDYYFGTVGDDGRFAYRAGQTIVAIDGTYDIYNKETLTTSDAPGTVRVTSYSHSGPGLASPTPIDTAAGLPDGSGGLTSESDAVLGTDGQSHPFNSASEASFPTTVLFGFVFTYADGAAFYSGTVADNGSFGTIPGSRTVTDSSGNVLGSYAIFAEGTTALPAGAVVVDRFTEGGTSYIPNGGTGAGGAGLGSEAGSITANGTSFAFSDHQEPAIPSAIVPLAITPAPSTADIVTAELTDLYQEVLNRNPDAAGLATYTAAIDAGTSLDSIRTTIAQSPEAQNDLNQLYLQIFGRNGDPGGLATYTAELIGGASLGSVELLLAQSPEAQSDINQIYQNVLARDADGGGLTTYMAALGQGTSLGQVRGQIAHSPEAQDDLTQLFQQVTGQVPGAAQLILMEDQIAQTSASQQTVAASLGATTGLAVITAGLGDASLTAQPLTPTLFVFNDIAFGHDTIAGFDATRDTIDLARTLAPDFATVQSELSSTAAGALLTLNQNQSILLGGVAPASLGATNFQIA